MAAPRTLIMKARKFRVDEQDAARADPDLNLLARYPAFLKIIHEMTGGLDDGSAVLFQPERLAELAEATRLAMQTIATGSSARAIVADIQADCWNLCDPKARQALGPEACRDVGELAIRDAMLAGFSFWLHDAALSRPSRLPRANSKPRSKKFRDHMSKATTAAWAKRKNDRV